MDIQFNGRVVVIPIGLVDGARVKETTVALLRLMLSMALVTQCNDRVVVIFVVPEHVTGAAVRPQIWFNESVVMSRLEPQFQQMPAAGMAGAATAEGFAVPVQFNG